MSGRGARSRKDIKKNIEKQEKKHEADQYAEDLKRPPSESGQSLPKLANGPSSPGRSGRRTSWAGTLSSHSSVGSRPGSRMKSDKAMSNLAGSEGKKYQIKGKETVAPRGRRGGVPPMSLAASVNTSSTNQSHDTVTPAGSVSRGSDRVWNDMKIWFGGGKTQRYHGFGSDSDLSFPDGDCLVYLSEEVGQQEHPPLLRLHVEKVQEARSSFLSNLILYGEIDADEYSPPPSVTGSNGSVRSYPLTTSNLGYLDENTETTASEFGDARRGSNQRSVTARSFNPLGSPGMMTQRKSRGLGPGNMGFPTPPHSRAQSVVASSAGHSNPEGEITHEIFFPAPQYITSAHDKRRHAIAVRNFFAILYDKPIVGTDLFEMLSELYMVMEIIYEWTESSRRPNTAAMLVDYIKGRKLDDVRGSLTGALGLLAWSEKQEICWDAGYMEAFIHAVGMLNPDSFHRPEFKRLSPVTRHNLEKAYNAMQIKILNAEDKLSTFDFPEIWHLATVAGNCPTFKSAEAFRSYLKNYYAQLGGEWPPSRYAYGKSWLTRDLVNRLQQDFGALYDILVNRDIEWNDCEERHTRKWQMASKSALSPDAFSPDLPNMPITDMLISFDNQHGYLHIPHPYPLLPRRLAQTPPPTKLKKNLFHIGRKDKDKASSRDPSEQMKLSLAFGDATNINKLGMNLEVNDLRDDFLEYEKSVSSSLPPADARLGRWILLYAILQVLSTLSVDTIGVVHSDGVPYFLCPSLSNCPPWPAEAGLQIHRHSGAETGKLKQREHDEREMEESSQLRSHCWTAPLKWEGRSGSQKELEGSSKHELVDERSDTVSELDSLHISDQPKEKPVQVTRDRKASMQSYQSYQYLPSPPTSPPPPTGLPPLPPHATQFANDLDSKTPSIPLRSVDREKDLLARRLSPKMQLRSDKDVPRRMMEYFDNGSERGHGVGGMMDGGHLPGYAR